MSKIWTDGGIIICLRKKWEKEKLLVVRIFSFSHNVYKTYPLLMRQNEYLWSKVKMVKSRFFPCDKGLTLYQTIKF